MAPPEAMASLRPSRLFCQFRANEIERKGLATEMWHDFGVPPIWHRGPLPHPGVLIGLAVDMASAD